MEGSESGFSPSNRSKYTAASHKQSSTGTGENNENDSSQDPMSSHFRNSKNAVVKHFMSPTISAASKAATATRKKILADRNENSGPSDTQLHRNIKRTPENYSISHSDRSPSRIVPSKNSGFESDDDGDNNSVADSSGHAYDPVTNYLTPRRPKYLRFNPNRRLEILNRLGKEGWEDLNSSFDSWRVSDEDSSAEDDGDSSLSPLKESVADRKNDESTEKDYEEEDEEELEEDRGWCLSGALEAFLLLIACLMSTSLIYSSNTPTFSPNPQSIWNLKDGYISIKNQTLEVISVKLHEAGFSAVEWVDNFSEAEEVEIREEDDNGQLEESVKMEIFEDNVVDLDDHDGDKIDTSDEASEFTRVSEIALEHKPEELIAAKTDESGHFCLVKEFEASHPGFNDENIDEIGTTETEVGLKKLKIESIETKVVLEEEMKGMNEDNIAKIETIETGVGLEKEIEGSHQLPHIELLMTSDSAKEKTHDPQGTNDKESLEELVGSGEKITDSGEDQEIRYDSEGEMEKAGLDASAVIILSAVSVILMPLAFFCHWKKMSSTSAEGSQPELNPPELAVDKEVGKKVAQPELMHPELAVDKEVKKKIEYSARPSFSISRNETREELNHHFHAPSVELIGEIVIGQESSRLRSCETKYRMNEFEESAFPPRHGLLSQPVSAPTQLCEVEHSTTDPPSYKIFTPERNVFTKKGGKSAEAGNEVVTPPLRRSARLRKRGAAAMSP